MYAYEYRNRKRIKIIEMKGSIMNNSGVVKGGVEWCNCGTNHVE